MFNKAEKFKLAEKMFHGGYIPCDITGVLGLDWFELTNHLCPPIVQLFSCDRCGAKTPGEGDAQLILCNRCSGSGRAASYRA